MVTTGFLKLQVPSVGLGPSPSSQGQKEEGGGWPKEGGGWEAQFSTPRGPKQANICLDTKTKLYFCNQKYIPRKKRNKRNNVFTLLLQTAELGRGAGPQDGQGHPPGLPGCSRSSVPAGQGAHLQWGGGSQAPHACLPQGRSSSPPSSLLLRAQATFPACPSKVGPQN